MSRSTGLPKPVPDGVPNHFLAVGMAFALITSVVRYRTRHDGPALTPVRVSSQD